MKPLSRDALARMVALHLPDAGFVNLGIGAPTHVADYLPADSGVLVEQDSGESGACGERRCRQSGRGKHGSRRFRDAARTS